MWDFSTRFETDELTGLREFYSGDAGRIKQKEARNRYVDDDRDIWEYWTADGDTAYKEILVDARDDLLCLAPHAGYIEPHTGVQALNHAADADASAWVFGGYRRGHRSHDTWHITSTEIDPDDFHYLDEIWDNRYDTVVAYHCFKADTPDALIGGAAPDDTKHALQEEIERAADVDATVATAADRYPARQPDNIVNRLSTDGGIQIEQTPDTLHRSADDIVRAVETVL